MTAQAGETIASLVKKRLKSDDPAATSGGSEAILSREISTLGFDSLDNLELIMEIEDSFGTVLDEDKVLACRTVADLAALVEATMVSA